MILTDISIKNAVISGDIGITPYDENKVNANSYDVSIGNYLVVYGKRKGWVKQLYYDVVSFFRTVNPIERIELPNVSNPLDCRHKTETVTIPIPLEGITLVPGVGYLANTREYTQNPHYIPVIYGKSSLGRNFLLVHFTAGFGDVGFNGNWTLELGVMHPLIIYPDMKIGQIVYFEPSGAVSSSYAVRPSSKYVEQTDAPVASKFHENFIT